jgi:S-methylmethionine-dependent homocysteine/selenocysteine methylase
LYQPERAQAIASPLVRGLAPYVDIWIAETQSLIAETVSVYQSVRLLDKKDKPFWAAFTVEDSQVTQQPQIRSGESVKQAVEAMVELGVDAILFNCSQPEVMESAIGVARETLQALGVDGIELGVYANAFPPTTQEVKANDGLDVIRDDLNDSVYTQMAEKWVQQGASLIGGCCGIGPEHIKGLSDHFTTR